MKSLLYTLIVFTTTAAQAEKSQTFLLTSTSCESGTTLDTTSALLKDLPNQIVIETEESKMTFVYLEGSARDTENFSLQSIGQPGPRSENRQTYMALQRGSSTPVSTTFVQTASETEIDVLLRTLDTDFTACGGGFIISKFEPTK